VNKQGEASRMFTNINDNLMSDHHELVKTQADNFRSELNLATDNFEKVLVEDIYYEVVPCVQVAYTHMLTNTEHTISIINVFEKPELVFHSQAEDIKRDVKNAGKAVGGVFGKLFKTKKYKVKEDRKNEIKLMIYLAKADGTIEDEEKNFLSEKISNLDEFTVKEKQEFFDLMNAGDLPNLTKEDVIFSTPEKGKEVVAELVELASADGDLEPREQKLIDDINALMS
jgi:tellurite resistance protein